MTDLKTQALRLILQIDTLLEPLEDTFEHLQPVDQARYPKLKRLIAKAEARYYRRSKLTASPWSLVTQIVEKAKAAPEPAVVEETQVIWARGNPWMGPLIK
jgi:hypothetical protein